MLLLIECIKCVAISALGGNIPKHGASLYSWELGFLEKFLPLEIFERKVTIAFKHFIISYPLETSLPLPSLQKLSHPLLTPFLAWA